MFSEEIESDTIIVGGGPSTLLFLINMLRSGKLLSLFKGRGVTILEKSKYFGCGRIEQYVINADDSMSVLDMFRLILKEPHCSNPDLFAHLVPKVNLHNSHVHSSTDAMPLHPPPVNLASRINEIMEECVLIGFKEVLKTNVYQELLKYITFTPPLSALGYFLRIVGNTLLRQIKSLKDQLIFRPYHEMQGVSLLNDGMINVGVKVIDPNGPTEQLYLQTETNSTEERNVRPQVLDHYKKAKCRVLLVCCGSKFTPLRSFSQQQSLPMSIIRGLNHQQYVIGDTFITDRGFTQAMRIIQMQRKTGKRKVIIQASDSLQEGLQSALLLLKGPLLYSQSETGYLTQLESASRRYTEKSNLSSNYNPQLEKRKQDETSYDVLSPFLQKRGLEVSSLSVREQPCTRCSAFQIKQKDQIHLNIGDSSIRVKKIGERNPSSSRGSVYSYLSGQSQISSLISGQQRMSINSSMQPAGNSYLSKRTGLSQAGSSVLNLHHSSMSPTTMSKMDVTDTRSISRLSDSLSSRVPLNSLSTLHTGFSIKNSLFNNNTHLAPVQECLCLGSIKPLVFRWKREDVVLADFKEAEILILLTNDQLAKKASSIRDLPNNLRNLLESIQEGTEKRVKLMKLNHQDSELQSIHDSIALFIDLDGMYLNSSLSIKGAGGEALEFKQDQHGMFSTDDNHRLVTPKGSIKNIFCMGLFTKSIQSQSETQRLRSVGQINEEESKSVSDCVVEAIASLSENQDDLSSWKWIDSFSIVKSINQSFVGQQEPDYESANIMSYFDPAFKDRFENGKKNKSPIKKKVFANQIDSQSQGLSFKGVESFINKKAMQKS